MSMCVKLIPQVAGGMASFSLVCANTDNATVVKALPGQVYSIYASNVNAATRYLKLYDKATAPAPASDVPKLIIGIPPARNASINFSAGIAFKSGISILVVTGIANTDDTAVAASEIAVNIAYA